MELHEIRYFLALSETLNFTRAAEKCNVSQPALTRAIRNLEDKLDAGPLVNRERGNTHLTELGAIMLPYFEKVVGMLDEASSRVQDYTRLMSSTLNVGLMCTIGPQRFIDLFARFSGAHPRIEVNLVDGAVPLLEERLSSGDLDVAVYAQPDPIDSRFHGLPLFDERFMVVVSPNHPLASKNAISMRDLNEQRYLGRAACEYFQELRRIRLEIG
ncbi:MAG: LysR family transcriptional regulator, partial [Rhizobiaceae bacterium]|nr:LysR family transcriptional regulator [Rhizobiaceae bacterium]